MDTLVFVSGKHYYALRDIHKSLGRPNISIIRLESLCPFPTHNLQIILDKYPKVKSKYEDYRETGYGTKLKLIKCSFFNL